MGVKKNSFFLMNWASSANAQPYNPNTPLSGTTLGVMSGTNTIFTNTQDISNFDNCGLVVTYTGTAVGTITIFAFNLMDDVPYSFTFNPALTQPSGATGGYLVNLTGVPFRYFYASYTNTSGSGTIRISIGQKDVN